MLNPTDFIIITPVNHERPALIGTYSDWQDSLESSDYERMIQVAYIELDHNNCDWDEEEHDYEPCPVCGEGGQVENWRPTTAEQLAHVYDSRVEVTTIADGKSRFGWDESDGFTVIR